jgi:hypothetical protein
MTENKIIEAVFALIVGFLIVISVPELKIYFDKIVGAVITGLILGIIASAIIFVVWLIMTNRNQGGF